MVIIISTVGATRMYQDRVMFQRTFSAFLHSLRRQTDQNFRLILTGHDRPQGLCIEERFATFYTLDADGSCELTNELVDAPTDMCGEASWRRVPYGRTIEDMSRKTKAACLLAGIHARSHRLPSFWMLRMDSDDLLAKDVVANLNATDPVKTRAVYSRTCHMYDPRRKELAEHRYPSSLTCNAIWVSAEGSAYPKLYYHFNDHTTFWQNVKRDGIPSEERDWQLCITTNSQNSISGRPELSAEQYVKQVEVTPEVVERYGLDDYERTA
jgi:hypothetical protein